MWQNSLVVQNRRLKAQVAKLKGEIMELKFAVKSAGMADVVAGIREEVERRCAVAISNREVSRYKVKGQDQLRFAREMGVVQALEGVLNLLDNLVVKESK